MLGIAVSGYWVGAPLNTHHRSADWLERGLIRIFILSSTDSHRITTAD